jgi:hypothetical protein
MSTFALLALGMLCPQDPPAPAPKVETIWDRLQFYGDGRLRAEATLDQPNGEDRYRGRMRVRVGANYEILEDLKAEARLTTSSDGNDANNPHWDFGDGADGFRGSDVLLDRFYLDWAAAQGLSLRGGKQPHVFASAPVFGDFVWDSDVQPAGVSAQWGRKSDSGAGFDVRAAGYVAVENGADDDPAMGGLQGNLYLPAGDDLKFQVSASYADWSSLQAGPGLAASNQGNTDPTADFNVLEGFVSCVLEAGLLGRTTLFVQAMHNTEDDAGESDGFAGGLQFGKSSKKGDANVFAVLYALDANCIFSPVAQDDTPIAGTGLGTGMEGVLAGGQYMITDNLSLKLWALTSDADAAEDPVRLRFDIDFRIK